MGDKRKTNFSLWDDTASSFEDENFILTYRPKIDFIEPTQEYYEIEKEKAPDTIDSLRDKTGELVDELNAAAKLIDLTQQHVDNKVKASGGMTIKLDKTKDAMTIAAMKRTFPDKADPTQITYDDYKQAINCLNNSGPAPLKITGDDLIAAQSEPDKTDFGGINNQNGENRAEISSPASTIQPLDLDAFQKAGVLALFALMLPLIKKEDTLEIQKHLLTAPHKPI
jgi:hypothetical protein